LEECNSTKLVSRGNLLHPKVHKVEGGAREKNKIRSAGERTGCQPREERWRSDQGTFLKRHFWGLNMSTNSNRRLRERAIGNSASSETLKHAAFRGQTDRIIEAIAVGADVNEPDCDGDTPLMLAAAQGHASIVAVLLRNGADVSAHNDGGETALHLAAYGGHTEAVRALLAAGSCVNARDNGGSTPLICAAFGGYADVASVLLDSGADVTIKNFGGHGALDLGARNGLDLRGKLLRFEQRVDTVPNGFERQVSSNSASAGTRR